MILKLIGKEFRLCLHPTSILFVFFACFVFIPNYPYEVAFFFSGLSVFFVCLTARENGDLPFTCALPVRKREVALARIFFCVLFQVALLLLTGVAIAVKELCFPASAQVNLAGTCANLALLGHGGLLLGIFNIVFFPQYFKNPNKVGVPFLVAAVVQFVCVALFCILRFTAPVYSDLLAAPFPQYIGAKATVFGIGIFLYGLLTVLACFFSARRFSQTDL